MSGVRVLPIRTDHLDALLAAGRDDDGNPVEPFTDSSGGLPLRCCLRDSTPGERVALIAYRAVRRSVTDTGGRAGGPYHESGPVFVHAERCEGADGEDYPAQWRSRQQVFRCYDRDGRITGGVIAPAGDGQEATLAELFADESVAFVHTRNVVHGCFMADVRRAAATAARL